MADRTGSFLAATLLSAFLIAPAVAHPHVWISARAHIEIDAQGRLVALTPVWTFDEFYSAFAVDGIDENRNGTFDAAELDGLAAVNMDALADYGYFTQVEVDGRPVKFGPAGEARNAYVDGLLTLSFRLPFAQPIPKGATARIAMFDPSFYISIEPVTRAPVSFTKSAMKCTVKLQPAGGVSGEVSLPEAAFEEGGQGVSYGAAYAVWMSVTCDGP